MSFSTGVNLFGEFCSLIVVMRKRKSRRRVFATVFHLLEIFDSHTYHYEVFIMGFTAQPFVKALTHFNKYLIEPIMILTAMKQLIKPFHLA